MRRVARGLVVASIAMASIATLSSAPPSAFAAATVPSGFTDVGVLRAGSIDAPTSIEYLSDGLALVLEQDGRIRGVSTGATAPGTPAGTYLSLNVCGGAGSEMGLLGLATDPNVAVNGHVYVYYTRQTTGGCVNRVSRFTLFGPSPASTEVVLLDNIPGTVTESAGNHNGGDLELATDGYLYVAVGDSGRDPRNNSGGAGGNDAAQDLSILSGKILRIGTDGSIPADNPYQGPGTARCATSGVSTAPSLTCQEIYASGLRNPYRFAFDPNPGSVRFFINDVGQNTREEVNLGAKGANYGWNSREGQCPAGENPPCAGPPAGVTDPITDYGHGDGCTYITAGAFVPNGVWPSIYDGAYVFADGGCGKIFVRFADGSVDYNTPFATGVGSVAHMAFLPDGAGYSLFYTRNGEDEVRKITYSGAVGAPTVSGLRMTPVSPDRVYDTRNNIGTGTGLMQAGTSRVIKLDRYPDAKAVLVNITLSNSRGVGFVQTWPTRTARPGTSTINSAEPFETLANASVVPVNEGSIIVSTTVTADLVVDVLGWYGTAASAGGEFRARAPERLIDTRQPSSTTNLYTEVGDHIDVQVTGKLGVPTDGTAGAVAFILTSLASDSPQPGYATAYPTGQPRPEASNINTSRGGDIRANLVIVPIGTGGKVSLYGFNTADLLVDVAGYVTAASVPLANTGQLTVKSSQRVVDTRTALPLGTRPLTAATSFDLSPAVPTGSTAVLQNITALPRDGWGFITASPDGSPVPTASNVNFVAAGNIRAALAITTLPANRKVTYSPFGATHLIVDVYGYFS